MLTAERHKFILEELRKKGSVLNTELMRELEASESTIRRDISRLAKEGRCQRVHGGAILPESLPGDQDDAVTLRQQRHRVEKLAIAREAAGLIRDGELIYLDAGTTTELMIDFIHGKDLTFVTNAISHARRLGQRGYTCYILGGQFKSVTEAIVGEEASLSVRKYNFSRAFLGANGVDLQAGFTTPELKEAYIKQQAMAASRQVYILADASKFGRVAPISFGSFAEARVLVAGQLDDSYRSYENIQEVSE